MHKETTNVIKIHEFGTAPQNVPAGYSLKEEAHGTAEQLQQRFGGQDVVLVRGANVHGQPGVFVVGVFAPKA